MASAPSPARLEPAHLEVSNLTCRRAGRTVFAGLSFALAGGELLALVGRNGAGKTTLLRALALLLRPAAGAIRWQGRDVGDDPEGWRGQLAWLGHLDGLKGDLAVRENLSIAQRLRGPDAQAARLPARVNEALAAFDLASLAQRPVRTLSAGQRRRTALARIVLAAAPVWLLDEPLNALDADARQHLRRALEGHLAGGGMVVAATHAELGLAGARSLELGTAR